MKQKIQIALALAIAIAAVRAGYILYERHQGNKEEAKKETGAAPSLNPDYYVTPNKLYPFDLKSAKQLTQQPVWVKEGYRYFYYPYNRATHHADFEHDAGMLRRELLFHLGKRQLHAPGVTHVQLTRGL